MLDIYNVHFTLLLSLLGTFAFAVSGIRLASGKNIDWFGAYVIGLVTAIGGGTIRDMLLDVTPFWMQDGMYLVVTGIALIVTLLFKEGLFRWGKTLFLFDAIGLGLFTIVGISKSLAEGWPFWVSIMMGVITGSLGGVMRDVLINEVPLLFRKDIYALACVAGGVVYYVCYKFQLSSQLSEIIGAFTVIFIRLLAIKFHFQLPILTFMDDFADNKKQ